MPSHTYFRSLPPLGKRGRKVLCQGPFDDVLNPLARVGGRHLQSPVRLRRDPRSQGRKVVRDM